MRLADIAELKERLAELERERRERAAAGDMLGEQRAWEQCYRVRERIEELERGGR